MKLENYYYWFEGVLSKDFCKDVINFAHQSKQIEQGKTGLYYRGFDEQTQLKKRNSNVAWLSEPWIYDEVHPFVKLANQNAGWNYEWSYSEGIQFTIYGQNQHYGWHIDCNDKPYENHNNPNYNGKVRKISTVVTLNDASEYEGGEFEFDFRNMDEGSNFHIVEKNKKAGSIVVFPSFVWHQVRPVTKGTRYSLVFWHLGQPWK